jgi:hypothetical protein
MHVVKEEVGLEDEEEKMTGKRLTGRDSSAKPKTSSSS